MNRLLYIGLNGLAGSGKDTVAKMLRTILSREWESIDKAKEYYNNTYTNPSISATFNNIADEANNRVMCIAYADQLKNICSSIFGIPVSRFYMNKSTAWICVTNNFEYTEIPPVDNIITAEEFYVRSLSSRNSNNAKYWMSLREILVYIGTYVLQQDLNKSVFVNIVRNTIRENCIKNKNLKYVIVTDNRFSHELDFIRENNGITMTISRSSIKQLPNVAEHSIEDGQSFDYYIDNNGSYDDLFKQLWDLVHEDYIFKNEIIELYTRDNVNNYLRLVDKDTYMLCTEFPQIRTFYSDQDDEYSMIDPTGGPMIGLGRQIDTTDYDKSLIPVKIYGDENYKSLLIKTKTQ